MKHIKSTLVASALLLAAGSSLASSPTVHTHGDSRLEVTPAFAQFDRTADVPIVIRHVEGPIPDEVKLCIDRTCQTFLEVERLNQPRLLWLPAWNLHAQLLIDGRRSGVALSSDHTAHTYLHVVGTLGAEASQYAEHVFNNDNEFAGMPHEFDRGIKAVDASELVHFPTVVHNYAAIVLGEMPSGEVANEIRAFVREGGTVSTRTEIAQTLFGGTDMSRGARLSTPTTQFDTSKIWARQQGDARLVEVGLGQLVVQGHDASDELLHLALVAPELNFDEAKKHDGYMATASSLAQRDLGSPVPIGAMLLFVLVAGGLGFGLFMWRRKDAKSLLRTLAIFSAATTVGGFALSIACNATEESRVAHFIVVEDGTAAVHTAEVKRPGGGYLFNDSITVSGKRSGASEIGVGWGTTKGKFDLDEHSVSLESDLSGVLTRVERVRMPFKGVVDRGPGRVVLTDLGFDPKIIVFDEHNSWAVIRNGSGEPRPNPWEAHAIDSRVERAFQSLRHRTNEALVVGLNANDEVVVMEWK